MKNYSQQELAEMRRCASRELAYRRHVYPRLVQAGKMRHDEAERETRAMEAIVGLLSDMGNQAAGVMELPGMESEEKTP